MTPDDLKRQRDAFDRLVSLSSEQREDELVRLWSEDAELAAAVESLLARDRAGDETAPMSLPGRRGPWIDPLVGQSFDGYTITRKIAEGGMGAVYAADEVNPPREVAIKLIKPGPDAERLARRFELEAALLGQLESDSIARVYRVGRAEFAHGEQPYIAMELIRGVPLSQYADGKRSGEIAGQALDLRQRLELFAEVATAVDRAHSEQIIHRDLKPGNILVTDDGRPKVLDFGLARAAHGPGEDSPTMTAEGMIAGTPEYMSPEQARGASSEIDQRSDVYSLGVVLYELLAGERPFRRDGRPLGTFLQELGAESSVHTRLGSFNRSFRGDLETITEKALARDKNERYASAAALAEDVRLYLRDEPIKARPPSTWVQLRKFARRNRALVGGVAASLVLLVAGTVATGIQLVRAQAAEALAESRAEQRAREAERAEKINALLSQLLQAATPGPGKRDTRLIDALAQVDTFIERSLSDRPDVEASVRTTVGEALAALGDYAGAEGMFSRALELHEQLPQDPASAGGVAAALGTALIELGRLEEAQAVLERWQERLDPQGQPDASAKVTLTLADLLMRQGQIGDAERFLDEGAGLIKNNATVSRLTSGYLHTTRGTLRWHQDRMNECLTEFQAALPIFAEELGRFHPDTVVIAQNIASIKAALGRSEEAIQDWQALLADSRDVLGPQHPVYATCLHFLGVTHVRLGQKQEGAGYLRQALDVFDTELGPTHPSSIETAMALADTVSFLGEYEESAGLARRALAYYDETNGPDSREALGALQSLNRMLHEQKQFTPESVELLRRELQLLELYEVQGWDRWQAMNNLGKALCEVGDYEAGIELLGELIELTKDTGVRRASETLIIECLRFHEQFESALEHTEQFFQREAGRDPPNAGHLRALAESGVEVARDWAAAETEKSTNSALAVWQSRLTDLENE